VYEVYRSTLEPGTPQQLPTTHHLFRVAAMVNSQPSGGHGGGHALPVATVAIAATGRRSAQSQDRLETGSMEVLALLARTPAEAQRHRRAI
jgi:hypothetical protein